MQQIDKSLRSSSLNNTIAIFGRNFSFDCKMREKTMVMFAVGIEGHQPEYRILIYDFALAGSAPDRVFTDQEFTQKLNVKKNASQD